MSTLVVSNHATFAKRGDHVRFGDDAGIPTHRSDFPTHRIVAVNYAASVITSRPVRRWAWLEFLHSAWEDVRWWVQDWRAATT